MEAIKVSNLGKRYKKSSRPSLDNVSLDLPQGCVLGLVGENGAGKTTLIKAITGSVKFDSGSIEVLGHDIDAASQNKTDDRFRQDIGTVLAEDSFPEIMTAGMIGNVMKSIYINWDSACYNRYLEKFGLDSKKKYKEYSRGMKMKLSIAVAMSHNAKLLLLDEATSGLDPVVRDQLLDEFNEFTRDENHSILISSHITSDLEKICDYIAFIHEGRIVMCDTKDAILDKYGILHCTDDVLAELEDGAVAGSKSSDYGAEALVVRSKVPDTFDISPVSLDDIIVYIARGIDNSKEVGR
ncbi:ABC transporter ATP-binding protein [[Bacteroides] pectinophilus]|uniref:ABC transporter domain-containing protein n=1 Tax=[Bacteroides] pectinophilus ATCC 43243 TaxID=483218 RepID=B7ASW0_9FIRM|nr:ABC transporter, ATP-binding protein [[Bacteroides] pectinophilus ATCC 43243]UWN94869.1 ABC transporter ATP-binding protein [[Bacteroides] pectinophilus]